MLREVFKKRKALQAMSEDITAHNNVIYATGDCRVVFDDNSETFMLELSQASYPMHLCHLITLRKKLQNIPWQRLLSADEPDVEILSLPHCDRFLLLTIEEIIEVNELLDGTFAMLELNSVIHQRLLRRIGA